MAQVTLTDRQKEIKARLDKGETPEKVGKALKITTNAVYQQIRRMRKAGVKVGGTTQTGSSGRKASGGSQRKPTSKAATPRRQSARTRQAPAPAAPQTAEELLRSEIADLKARAEIERGRIVEANGVIAEATTAIEGIEAEAATREDVLAVLTGEKVAHAKPQPKAETAKPKGKANGGKGGKPQAASEAASAPEEATSDATPAEEAPAPAEATEAAAEAAPTNGGTAADAPEPSTQAEREATADFDPFTAGGDAAEAEAAQAAAEQPQTA